MPLLHPAAALRTPSLVETLQADFAKLPGLLAEPVPQAETEPVGALTAAGADQLDLFG
jgi:hypothetical protein